MSLLVDDFRTWDIILELVLVVVMQVLILLLDIKEPAESVLGRLSPTAADPPKAPCRIEASILLDCTWLMTELEGPWLVTIPVMWDWLSAFQIDRLGSGFLAALFVQQIYCGHCRPFVCPLLIACAIVPAYSYLGKHCDLYLCHLGRLSHQTFLLVCHHHICFDFECG
jgi:hypothetical protein